MDRAATVPGGRSRRGCGYGQPAAEDDLLATICSRRDSGVRVEAGLYVRRRLNRGVGSKEIAAEQRCSWRVRRTREKKACLLRHKAGDRLGDSFMVLLCAFKREDKRDERGG